MGLSCYHQLLRMSASVVILLNLFVLSLAPPVVDQEPSTATSSEDGTGNHHDGQLQPGWWHYHGQQGGFGGMSGSGGMPGYGGPQLGFWHEHDARDEHGHDSSHGFGIRHGHDASGLWWHGDGRLGRPGDAWPDELFWWW